MAYNPNNPNGQAAAASSQPVTLSNENVQDLYVTGQSAQTATVNNILTAASGSAATDVTGYRSVSVQIVSTGTGGTFTFEGSNDNTNFQTVPMFSQLVTNTFITAAVTATSSQIIYIGPLNFRYFRVRIATTITGGSIQAFTTFKQTSFSPAFVTVQQPTAGNLQVTATMTGTTVQGVTAHSSAAGGAPLIIGGKVIAATPDLTLVAGDAVMQGFTDAGQAMTKPYSPAVYDFTFNGTIGNTTTAVVFKAAAGASIRNNVASITLTTDVLGTASALVIRDGPITASSVAANVITSTTHDLKIGDQIVFSSIGSFTGAVINTPYWVLTVPSATTFSLSATPNGSTLTVGGSGSPVFNRILFRTKLQTTALTATMIQFPIPLRGMPNNTMDIQTESSTTSGTVYYNVGGFISF